MAALVKKETMDWKSYEAKAVMRGKLMLCISPEIARSWYVAYDKDSKRQSGGQLRYTERCMEDVMTLKYLFGIAYRHLEGFLQGLLALAGLDLPAPDRSTINYRANRMHFRLPKLVNPKAGYVVSIDSTGLKIHGQGEWNRKKHQQKDHTNWVKMHIAVDHESMQILSVESTANDVQDPEVFDTLINGLPHTPGTVMGDGAYDTFAAYERSLADGFNLVTPPRDNAVVHSNSKLAHVQLRNKHVAYFLEKGIYAWATKNDYWQRNRVETTMSRYVTTFGDRMSSRTVQAQKNEIVIKCRILNEFMAANGVYKDSAA
jgi:Transposase DDE domain